MELLIISDFHSRNPIEFIKRKSKEIDEVVCLGDYDDPTIVEQLLSLEKQINLKTTLLPGNHDYALANHYQITSLNLSDPFFYMELWKKNNLSRNFINNAPTTLEKTYYGKKFIFSHSEFPLKDDGDVYKNELWKECPFMLGEESVFKKCNNKKYLLYSEDTIMITVYIVFHKMKILKQLK